MTEVNPGADSGADSGAAADAPIRRPEWVAHVLDESTGEPHAVLLHLPRGERTALSPTATRVWQLVVAAGPEGVRMGDLVPVLAAEYGADPMIIEHDVAALLAQLLTGEWVEVVPGPDGQTSAHSGGSEGE